MELYIHLPFCVKKCKYCSFVSFAGLEDRMERYALLLLKEAEKRAPEIHEPVETVYVGGGTPSLFPPALWKQLFTRLRTLFSWAPEVEFTAEANPGTLTAPWLEAALSSGVNRLSLGMQAFQPKLLQTLGRIHTWPQVQTGVEAVRAAGIRNLNLDLMFGLPGQSLAQWEESLSAALSLSPEHISAYGLIPEEGTPLGDAVLSGAVALPEVEEEREMYDVAIGQLKKHGLQQYEISNFARPGAECRHNIGYWTQVPYLGLGLAAASLTVLSTGPSGMRCRRRTNPETFAAYEQLLSTDTGLAPQEEVSPAQARFETMMLGLRMNAGVEEAAFARLHGVSLEQCYGKPLRRFEASGLCSHAQGRWQLTRRGFDLQNSMLVELMDD